MVTLNSEAAPDAEAYSQEFRDALLGALNGQGDRVIKAVDNRFARLERRLGALESAITPVLPLAAAMRLLGGELTHRTASLLANGITAAILVGVAHATGVIRVVP